MREKEKVKERERECGSEKKNPESYLNIKMLFVLKNWEGIKWDNVLFCHEGLKQKKITRMNSKPKIS